MGNPKIKINKNICLACSGCISICTQDALSMVSSRANIDNEKCISCGICITTCPIGAIKE